MLNFPSYHQNRLGCSHRCVCFLKCAGEGSTLPSSHAWSLTNGFSLASPLSLWLQTLYYIRIALCPLYFSFYRCSPQLIRSTAAHTFCRSPLLLLPPSFCVYCMFITTVLHFYLRVIPGWSVSINNYVIVLHMLCVRCMCLWSSWMKQDTTA